MPTSEQGPRRHVQSLSDIDQPLIKQAAPAVLDIDQYVAGHSRAERQGLLGHLTLQAQRPDPSAHCAARALPGDDALGVVLLGASRHAPQLWRSRTNCLPY